MIDQFGELSPAAANLTAVDGFSVDGADAAGGYQFTSQATGATDADSFRAVAISGSTLIVIDVQGAANVEVAQTAATALLTAQLGCIGQTTCAVPELPAELTAA